MSTRKKVLLSVELDDLAAIDANAKAAGLSRSAYMVAAARSRNTGSIALAAVRRLVADLRKAGIALSGGNEPT